MIEWLASSCFSFLESPSRPEDLASQLLSLGYTGFALADRMSQSGLVRALHGVQQVRTSETRDFFFAPGIRLHFDVADPLFVYPLHKKAHASLCQFLSQWALAGMEHQEKGLTPLRWRDFISFLRKHTSSTQTLAEDFILITVSGFFYPWVHASSVAYTESRVSTQDAQSPQPFPKLSASNTFPFWLLELVEACGSGPTSALSWAYPTHLFPGSDSYLSLIEQQALALSIPLLATQLPLFVLSHDQELCDLMHCIRHRHPLKTLGYLQQSNGERRFLNSAERGLRKKLLETRLRPLGISPLAPFERSEELRKRHHFCLTELTYQYPREKIPVGKSPHGYLKELVDEGLRRRYPQEIPSKTLQQAEHELSLIRSLNYEDYFLTIYDVLSYAREQKILHQGRGSAANSVVCYALGITAVDPVDMDLLFERFLSMERREPPDIDVDFEHARREEVLQEIYRRYGRQRAAMVASYICFRGRMAFRETAKAWGLSSEALEDCVAIMGREGLSRLKENSEHVQKLLRKHALKAVTFHKILSLAERLKGLPRHLGLHTGGFVLADEDLSQRCVLEPARMAQRSVIPWDKDDIDTLKWMKVDFLSLGMLTALQKSFDLIEQSTGHSLSLSTLPQNCPATYRAIRRADTVGVFQIESRAQMNMLPRLAPRNFYDLVVEVAIVRPGPLQGGMVHPYLKRRQGLEPINYEHPDLEPILKKTLGVSIFQEQVMKMAIAVAGFKPGEADLLRKAMSGVWRSRSHMHTIRTRLFEGMKAHGISESLIERLYKQIEGFGEYGFPESHAASFALLTYASAWIKTHYPAQFLCALLNSQPLGFYSPRALVLDAEQHGVTVLPIDAFHSAWNSTLEPSATGPIHVRLGLHLIQGLSLQESEALILKQALWRKQPQLPSVSDLHLEGIPARTLEKLIRAGALRQAHSSSKNSDPRAHQLWEWLDFKNSSELRLPALHAGSPKTSHSFLKDYDAWKSLLMDYKHVGLSPGQHPTQMAREKFFTHLRAWKSAEDLYRLPPKSRCAVLGLLAVKQRPPTAQGMAFLTLEDETGFMNIVLKPDVYEKCRLILEGSSLLVVEGWLQKSVPHDPQDPYSASVSLQAQSVWNPFVATASHDPALTERFQARHYR